MNYFLRFIFIFFIGCIFGWILEVFYRRIEAKKWVNPGFLTGPYLPIYGFAFCTLTDFYLIFESMSIHPIFIILIMGISLTIIELIGGILLDKGFSLKLWDYSNIWGNYKGLICPIFSFFWTLIGSIYYFFIAEHILNLLEWFNNNVSFSFILGMFFGILIIDFIYSTELLYKVKELLDFNNIELKFEELKSNIKNFKFRRKGKVLLIGHVKKINFIKENLIKNIKK